MSNRKREGDPVIRFIAANKRVSTASVQKRFGQEGVDQLGVLELKGIIKPVSHQGRRVWVMNETRITGIESMSLTSEGIETVFKTERAGVMTRLAHLEKQELTVKDVIRTVDPDPPDNGPPEVTTFPISVGKVKEAIEDLAELYKDVPLADPADFDPPADIGPRTLWIGFSNCDHSVSYLKGETPPDICPTCDDEE